MPPSCRWSKHSRLCLFPGQPTGLVPVDQFLVMSADKQKMFFKLPTLAMEGLRVLHPVPCKSLWWTRLRFLLWSKSGSGFNTMPAPTPQKGGRPFLDVCPSPKRRRSKELTSIRPFQPGAGPKYSLQQTLNRLRKKRKNIETQSRVYQANHRIMGKTYLFE